MKLKVLIKTRLADRALLPLRAELIELIATDSSLLDVGCGTGDLLFQAEHKLGYGFGVDIDEHMIKFARRKCEDKRISNLAFEHNDLVNLQLRRFDVATSTLCLHEMKEVLACSILKYMAEKSERVLVADYTKPKSLLAKFAIEFDEMISGHYQSFRRYRKAGGILAYANKSGLKVNRVIPSSIDGIAIWELHT
ncbi:Methylase involved in ubiquinone/menaquinone biosynthesis [Alteromonadaceae bacterium Bs31]|nr:Methylase involved in ubiquinone/menaquinone biosynthesis [Alteromonadaceae bacterium Bs31]